MKYLFTPERYKQLESMLLEMIEKTDESARRGFQSGSEQDGHHDEGFQLGLRETAINDKRLSDLEKIYKNAEVMVPIEQDDIVQFGNGVEIIYQDGEVVKCIVESYSFGFSEKEIVSMESPLGQAILGTRTGDERKFTVNNKTITVKIGKILPPSRALNI
jgi:transcription elongation factor GreA